MIRFFLGSIFCFSLFACASNDDGPTQNSNGGSGNTDIDIVRSNALVDEFLWSYTALSEVRLYTMVGVIGELVTNDTTPNTKKGEQIKCMDPNNANNGTFSMTLDDKNGNSAIDPGESNILVFNNCYSTASNPVNGTLFEELISYSENILQDQSIDILDWTADFTFSGNFSRLDRSTGNTIAYFGKYGFDNKKVGNGYILKDKTTNFSATINGVSVSMPDLTFISDNSIDASIAKLSISGFLSDPTYGTITVTSDQLQIENFNNDVTSKLTGNLTLSSNAFTVSLNFFDWNDIVMSLDSNKDGIVDQTWNYKPDSGTPSPMNLIGTWSASNNSTMVFTATQITLSYASDMATGSYIDESTATQNRFKWTIAQDTSGTFQAGTVMFCLYEFLDATSVDIACNTSTGVNDYPANINDTVELYSSLTR